jgi:GTP-binding protein
MQRQWQHSLEAYFRRRRCLCGVMLIMDIRRPLTDFDWQMIRWCEACERPVHIALTKADKLRRGRAKEARLETAGKLREVRVPVSVQLFSASQRTGIDQAHERLDEWLQVGRTASQGGVVAR